jgi:GAF domain-containing protein
MSNPAANSLPTEPVSRLTARIDALESERRRHLAIIELLRELTETPNYRDIVQTVARRLGNALGLDRCSVFLAERSRGTVHLVASYEDPSLRNLVVDIAQYPELRRALDTGEVVNIPDVVADPQFGAVQNVLTLRRVRSITVVPLIWRRVAIGAVFLRTTDQRPSLDDGEIEWARQVADVTANALRTASRIERLQTRLRGGQDAMVRDRERAALIDFLRRMLDTFARRERETDDQLLPRAGEAELERLVGVALRVLGREATR